MDYTNKPKATAIDDKERSPLDLAYHDNIMGKFKCKCKTCGIQFWAERKRKVCSVACLRNM